MAPLSRVVDAFLKSTLEMWHRFGATSEPHLWTKVISTSLAGPAVVTRDADFESNPVADLIASHGLANGDDDTGRFMAKR